MPQPNLRDKMGTLRALIAAARPFRKRFIVIAVLALLGTAADLMEPLIYRIAINDVAGLFVGRAERPGAPSTTTGQTPRKSAAAPEKLPGPDTDKTPAVNPEKKPASA